MRTHDILRREKSSKHVCEANILFGCFSSRKTSAFGQAFQKVVPKQYQKIVKTYFTEITKTS